MSANTNKGYRKGAIKDRSQFYNTSTGNYTKRDTTTGQFMDQKTSSEEKFVGVTMEKPKTN